MNYLKLLLRLFTLVFPVAILLSILAFCSSPQGALEVFNLKESSLIKADDIKGIALAFLIFNVLMTKWFTKNIKYDNPIVTWLGGSISITYLIAYFVSIPEVVFYSSMIGALYMIYFLFGNLLSMAVYKKPMGAPGLLPFNKCWLDSMNNDLKINKE